MRCFFLPCKKYFISTKGMRENATLLIRIGIKFLFALHIKLTITADMSDSVKMPSGYIESDFVLQNSRCWQEMLTL